MSETPLDRELRRRYEPSMPNVSAGPPAARSPSASPVKSSSSAAAGNKRRSSSSGSSSSHRGEDGGGAAKRRRHAGHVVAPAGSTPEGTKANMFDHYQPWVIQTYGDQAKTKTITLRKHARILRTLRGEESNSVENSKFRFWVKAKGFCIGRPPGYVAKPADGIVGTQSLNGRRDDPPLYVPTAPGKDEDNLVENTTENATTLATSTSTLSTSRGSSSSSNSKTSNKRKSSCADNTSEVMSLIGQKLQTFKEEDSFDRFGKHVADRLRAVNSDQVKFAMKLISDVLFEADLTSLGRNSKVMSGMGAEPCFSSGKHMCEGQQTYAMGVFQSHNDGQHMHIMQPSNSRQQLPSQQQSLLHDRQMQHSDGHLPGDPQASVAHYVTVFDENNIPP